MRGGEAANRREHPQKTSTRATTEHINEGRGTDERKRSGRRHREWMRSERRRRIEN